MMTLIYNKAKTLNEIREEIFESSPSISKLGQIVKRKFIKFTSNQKISNEDIKIENINFYMTDIISKNSRTMARAYKERLKK